MILLLMCVISVFHSLFCINDTLDIHTNFILTGICKIFDDHKKLITSRKKNAPQSDLCLGGSHQLPFKPIVTPFTYGVAA